MHVDLATQKLIVKLSDLELTRHAEDSGVQFMSQSVRPSLSCSLCAHTHARACVQFMPQSVRPLSLLCLSLSLSLFRSHVSRTHTCACTHARAHIIQRCFRRAEIFLFLNSLQSSVGFTRGHICTRACCVSPGDTRGRYLAASRYTRAFLLS